MGKKVIVVCDNCGTETEESQAGFWLAVEVDGLTHNADLHETLTLCSYKCLGKWADKKEQQLG